MQTPEVTVVVPTYGRAAAIGPTLAGALGQEDIELEVVVVDDCSPDGTAERLAKVSDHRLRVLRQDVNGGVGAARNRGIAEARGEWIAFLDDDDLWAPRKLREQIDLARAASADIAFSAVAIVNGDLEMIGRLDPFPVEDQPRMILQRSAVPAGSSNLVARTQLIRAVGGIDPELGPLADWDLFTRLLLAAPHACSDERHVGYLFHPFNMSSAHLVEHFDEFERLEERYRAERDEHGVRIDGVSYSRWLAGGLRRSGNRRDAARAYTYGAIRYRSPGNFVRLGGLLLGERMMRLGRAASGEDLGSRPEWLDLYLPNGQLHRAIEDL